MALAEFVLCECYCYISVENSVILPDFMNMHIMPHPLALNLDDATGTACHLRRFSLIDRLNTRQAINFSIAY